MQRAVITRRRDRRGAKPSGILFSQSGLASRAKISHASQPRAKSGPGERPRRPSKFFRAGDPAALVHRGSPAPIYLNDIKRRSVRNRYHQRQAFCHLSWQSRGHLPPNATIDIPGQCNTASRLSFPADHRSAPLEGLTAVDALTNDLNRGVNP